MLDNEALENTSDACRGVMFSACFYLIKCILALELHCFNTSKLHML